MARAKLMASSRRASALRAPKLKRISGCRMSVRVIAGAALEFFSSLKIVSHHCLGRTEARTINP
jgi:hypothetical protein